MKNRLPRKRKKAIRDCFIYYDINSLPYTGGTQTHGDLFKSVIDILHKEGVLIYSSRCYDGTPANKPEVFPKHLAHNIKLKDEA